MAKIYFRKIRAGELNINTGEPWCIDDVPARWKAAVQEMLDAVGQRQSMRLSSERMMKYAK